MYIYIYIYIYTHIHTHIHMHTFMCRFIKWARTQGTSRLVLDKPLRPHMAACQYSIIAMYDKPNTII